MKFCRFLPVSTPAGRTHAPVYGLLDPDAVREINGLPWSGWVEGHTLWDLKNVRMLAPCGPSKIVCVGRNYAAHAAELGNEMPKEPLLFLKPPSSIIGPEEAIMLPKASNRVEHEGELGVVIGKRCSHLSDEADPLSFVLGYTCVNDVTARDLQKADVQFTRAKGFDSFCPVGPHIETQLDPANALVECRVNGQTRQSSSTELMTYPVAFLIRYISHIMTLMPGDLIATGTPAGVGALVANDTVEVSVAGIGVLRNPVQGLGVSVARATLFG
ncbi:MAG TPA: fumarylacetoacetate hydrolase family protein [Candidatus Acidoferrales bacterium]|jgi:2-keto-4-pentenoate hydratase/2-oxohepta-3-ene-1,7-dioic acid hydratase in catechol pathway|nr:fumarylacetoacetate hydrolase family protein [Candidatus Acidoferrales bacterium]